MLVALPTPLAAPSRNDMIPQPRVTSPQGSPRTLRPLLRGKAQRSLGVGLSGYLTFCWGTTSSSSTSKMSVESGGTSPKAKRLP